MSHSSPPSGCPFHAAQNRATTTDSPRPANGTPAAGVVPDPATVLAATRLWVEKAVVGLNLRPFANAVLKKGRLHIQVSKATEPLALLEDLRTELKRLLDAPETEIETSLLVCPRMLSDQGARLPRGSERRCSADCRTSERPSRKAPWPSPP